MISVYMLLKLPKELEQQTCYQCIILMNQLQCYKINKKEYLYIDNSKLISVPFYIPTFFHKSVLYYKMLPHSIRLFP